MRRTPNEVEAALAGVPSAVWLGLGLIPFAAVVFIVADFPLFIAIPPALAAAVFFSLSLWAWRARRRGTTS